MSCIKNNSIVNDIMFAPPYPSYTKKLGVCWIKEICCLFLEYKKDFGPIILTSYSNLETHPVIILCHGNACDIGQMLDFCKELSSACKTHIVLYEYPGYGLSYGVPSEASCTQGIMEIIDHLNTKMKIPIQNMIFYGQSIGSGIATNGYKYCKTTLKCSPAGLILISPYLSITSLKNDMLSSYVPILERFDTKENIKCCDTSLLIIHGEKDALISVNHGIKLNKIAQCPINILDVVTDSTHNDIPYIRIVNNCKDLLDRISNCFVYKVKYINNMCWDSDNDINFNPQFKPMCTKIMATSLEATSATSVNAIDYVGCSMF